VPAHHEPPNTPTTKTPTKPTRPGRRIAAWWTTAWSDNGVLHRRWNEIRTAPDDGWHGMANWIKTVLAANAVAVVILLLDAAGDVLLHAGHRLLGASSTIHTGTGTDTGVWAVISHPAHTYITTHTTGLPITPTAVYTLWLTTGAASFTIGLLTRSNGVRLTWTVWGATTAAMVWSTTPTTGRPIATGITILAWATASTLALRGLNLRPRVVAHIYNTTPEIRPTINLPSPTPPGDIPDNVTPIQR
jgi:hypothetical protein